MMLAETPTAAAVSHDRLPDIADAEDGLVFLGIDDGETAWFGIDLSQHPRDALSSLGDGAKLVPLRRVGPVMPRADGALLAYARGMMHWHRQHRHCGVCGAPTASRNGGHLRVCCNDTCGAEHFPRTDPAVIMLVTHRDESGNAANDSCLLARQARWPQGMMSTLAGFVEPGESLEEAVAREVLEETGVPVAVAECALSGLAAVAVSVIADAGVPRRSRGQGGGRGQSQRDRGCPLVHPRRGRRP